MSGAADRETLAAALRVARDQQWDIGHASALLLSLAHGSEVAAGGDVDQQRRWAQAAYLAERVKGHVASLDKALEDAEGGAEPGGPAALAVSAESPTDAAPTAGDVQSATYALTGIMAGIRRINESDLGRIDRQELRNEVACLVEAGEVILKGLRERF